MHEVYSFRVIHFLDSHKLVTTSVLLRSYSVTWYISFDPFISQVFTLCITLLLIAYGSAAVLGASSSILLNKLVSVSYIDINTFNSHILVTLTL